MEFKHKVSKQTVESLILGGKPSPGATLVINGRHDLHIQVSCDGRIPDMGYNCYLDPGHKGKCWAQDKIVDFAPERGGPSYCEQGESTEVIDE